MMNMRTLNIAYRTMQRFALSAFLFHKEEQDPAWCQTGVSSMGEDEKQRERKKGKTCRAFQFGKSQRGFKSTYVSFCYPLGHVYVMLDKAVRNAKIQEAKDKQEDKEVIKILLDILKHWPIKTWHFEVMERKRMGTFVRS